MYNCWFLGPASQPSPAPPASAASSGIAPDELDPELVRYLDRDYWEQKEKEKAAEKAKSVNNQPSSLQITSPPGDTAITRYKTKLQCRLFCYTHGSLQGVSYYYTPPIFRWKSE